MQRATAISLGFAGLRIGVGAHAFASVRALPPGHGFGPLEPDPEGVLDLPAGFAYRVISRVGEETDDGMVVPPMHDGMAAFEGPDGLTLIVRNHEAEWDHEGPGPWGTDFARVDRVDRARIFDHGHGRPLRGGTTTLVYDTRSRELVRHFLSLAGTERNCAGGPTPRGSWISCEETVTRRDEHHERDHGWCFEVPATAEPALAEPVPITPMGRFNHEACATDPRTGVVYMTEDRHDGLLYRYVPENPDRLLEGGRLQALVVEGRRRMDTRNWDGPERLEPGARLPCSWIDLEDVESPGDDLRFQGYRKGAARFARGEGMWLGTDGIYFCCTNGGRNKMGQIFRITLPDAESDGARRPATLELFIEPNDVGVLEKADNVTVSPWGDLIVCEDGDGEQFLVGVTPDGELYKFARNAISGSEFAGATFSPDGTTLFVNIQAQGLTLAITGPWKQ